MNPNFNHDVAIAQLGGYGRLSAMTGANNFMLNKAEASITFTFKGSRKANRVTIQLNGSDLYNVRFYKFNRRTLECPVVHESTDVFCEDLIPLFENVTGLYLTL